MRFCGCEGILELTPEGIAWSKKLLHVRHAFLHRLCCALPFDTTVTFTTAGVTRAASVSIARSSVSSAATLLSSSGAAAGAGAAARRLRKVERRHATRLPQRQAEPLADAWSPLPYNVPYKFQATSSFSFSLFTTKVLVAAGKNFLA